MGTISMYVNHKETVDLCTKLDCLDSELNRVVKASLLNQNTSRFYREIGAKSEIIDEKSVIDEYLRTTEVGIILLQRSELVNKPVFTPKSS